MSVPEELVVGPGWRATLASLERLPQGALSRLLGRLADVPLPRAVRRPILGAFVRLTGIRMDEAAEPLEHYRSVNDLFVRRLAPGLRRWPDDPGALVSPVDGVVGAFGRIRDGTLIQAKGLTYGAARLLGGPADRYEGGLFLTLYLSPRHYHRIHTPLPGRVVQARHVPGRLLPVNGPSVASIQGLFATNERLIAELDTALGRVAVVAVGATNVGRISAAFDPAWAGGPGASVTNRPSPPPGERNYPEGVAVAAGDELMAFHLGSTVVLLTEPGPVPDPAIAPATEVRVGSILARRPSLEPREA
ncbi:MAG TPA: archaetidylserine decarboxylase [Longimicrobiales bacterium]|nr:archaetidylserine decarboxylase [Longimicrobiales bacterium]